MTRQKARCTHEVFFRLCEARLRFRQTSQNSSGSPLILMIVRSLISCRTAFLCILLVCFDPAAVLSVLAATPLL